MPQHGVVHWQHDQNEDRPNFNDLLAQFLKTGHPYKYEKVAQMASGTPEKKKNNPSSAERKAKK